MGSSRGCGSAGAGDADGGGGRPRRRDRGPRSERGARALHEGGGGVREGRFSDGAVRVRSWAGDQAGAGVRLEHRPLSRPAGALPGGDHRLPPLPRHLAARR
ncbi:MAG: hypothetical protein EXR72_11095 [Myxococcales bacterium]|nr:hypothetical protein [Myxococcales bacterium]